MPTRHMLTIAEVAFTTRQARHAGLGAPSTVYPQNLASALFGTPTALPGIGGAGFALAVSRYQPKARLKHDCGIAGVFLSLEYQVQPRSNPTQ